jgi:hypothetical protein
MGLILHIGLLNYALMMALLPVLLLEILKNIIVNNYKTGHKYTYYYVTKG